MTLKEIIKSDVKISEGLLHINRINIISLDEELDLSEKKYLERLLSVLLILEKSHQKSTEVVFRILLTYLSLGNYEEMLVYAKEVYARGIFKNDILLILYLLERILDREIEEVKDLRVGDILNPYNVYGRNIVNNQVRRHIYANEFNLARKVLGQSNPFNKWEIKSNVIVKLLRRLCDLNNERISGYIEKLDIDALENYYNSFSHYRKIDYLNTDLLTILNNVAYGYIIEKKDEERKPVDIYDALITNDFEYIKRGSSSNIVTYSFVDKILKLNQENKEILLSGNTTNYLDSILEKTYKCFKNKDIDSLIKIIGGYLENIGKMEFSDLIFLLIYRAEKKLDTKPEEIDTILTDLMETLIEVSKPLDEKGLFFLEKKIKARLGNIEEHHPYSKIYKLDINYNYGIENIEYLFNRLQSGELSLGDEFSYTDTEEYLYTLALLARECYRVGDKTQGDELIATINNSTFNKKEYKELLTFVKLILDSKEILPFSHHEKFNESIKQLINEKNN